jgi:hypothetical protein
VARSRQHLGFPSFPTNVLPDGGRAAPHGAPLIAARYRAQIYVSETTLTYLQCVKPRTPSLAKLARTRPLLFGQPFDTKAALGFIRATSSAGFGTQRGFLCYGPQPVGDLVDGASLPGSPTWTVIATPGHTDDGIAL